MMERTDLFTESYAINSETILRYNKLPLQKGNRKHYYACINDIPCVIFRQKSYRTALKYLMKRYSLLKYYDYDDLRYAPSIFDCFVSHGRAEKFTISSNNEEHELVAFLDLPPWDSADKDLLYLLNLIHYVTDSQENPDGVFMDDYGLC